LHAVHSQENKQRANAFLINPLILIANIFQNALLMEYDSNMYYFYFTFDYQRAINNNFSFTVSPLFGTARLNNLAMAVDLGGNILSREDEIRTEYEYSLRLGVEFRPFKMGLKNVYIGLHPSFGFLHINSDNYKDVYFNIGLFSISGYQWIFNNGFSIKLGGGVGYDWLLPFSRNSGEKRTIEYLFDLPFNLFIDFSIGYTF
jgi:hypothetical protein